jgi:hypothetical protein
MVIDKFNEEIEGERSQKETAMRKIEELRNTNSQTIDFMRRGKLKEDDGAGELDNLNAQINDIECLFDNSEDINVKECWDFTKST